jgi:DNA-binding PadR family transcriptional regulator
MRIRELDVLQALHPTEWRYGLQIMQRICESQGKKDELGWNLGKIYPILRKLETEGLAEAKWGDDSEIRHGARRRYYRLTNSGHRRRVDLETENESVTGLVPKIVGGG